MTSSKSVLSNEIEVESGKDGDNSCANCCAMLRHNR